MYIASVTLFCQIVLALLATSAYAQISNCCGNTCTDATKAAAATNMLSIYGGSCSISSYGWECGHAYYFSSANACPTACGDGICDSGRGETSATCETDCGPTVSAACAALGAVALNPLLSDAMAYQLGSGAGGTNVTAAWNLGITGAGIQVTVIDDGLQYSHPELRCRYNASHSYNAQTNSADPDPFVGAFAGQAAPYAGDNSHGTFCAGIAVGASNRNCSVGMAYDAFISGVRYLGTNGMTASATAAAFTYHNIYVDVYSMSLGAADDAVTLDLPSTTVNNAFKSNVANGRSGKGTIIVHAAGNGAASGDYCSYDAYCNVPWTIDVGAINAGGTRTFYSEYCSCLFVVAPGGESSGANARGMVSSDLLSRSGYVTTANGGMCSVGADNLQGTSFATPAVAGIMALILQANPNLGWRDVQKILAVTSDKNDPTNAGWTVNGAGIAFNPQYGFGRINAGRAVQKAMNWTKVGPQLTRMVATKTVSLAVTSTTAVTDTFTIAAGSTNISKLEHVTLKLSATNAVSAGTNNLRVILLSPSGTQSVLAYGRVNSDGINFAAYPLMSVHFWDESPVGTWTVKLQLNSNSGNAYTWTSYSVELLGSRLSDINNPCGNPCGQGQYCSSVTQTCTNCAAGTFSAAIGANSSLTCQTCPAGKYSSAGASSCTTCAAGTYSTIPGATSAASCLSCPAGTASSTLGASSAATCISCAQGTYAIAGSASCTQCAAGKYSTTPNATSAAACVSCPAGTASSTVGASSAAVCQTCGQGTYATSGSASCTLCPLGSFSNVTGGSSALACMPCAAGTFAPTAGSVVCAKCPSGTTSSFGAAQCKFQESFAPGSSMFANSWAVLLIVLMVQLAVLFI